MNAYSRQGVDRGDWDRCAREQAVRSQEGEHFQGGSPVFICFKVVTQEELHKEVGDQDILVTRALSR